MAQKIVKLKDLVPGFSYKLAEDYEVKKIPGIMPGGLGDPYKAENKAKNKLRNKPHTFIFFDQSWGDTIAYFLDENPNQNVLKERAYTHHGDKRVYYDVEIHLKFLPNGLETNFIELAPGIAPLAKVQGKSVRNAYEENAAYNQSRPGLFAGLFQAQQGEVGAGAGAQAAAEAEEEAKNNNNVNMKLDGGKRRMKKSRKHSRKHTKKQKSRRKH